MPWIPALRESTCYRAIPQIKTKEICNTLHEFFSLRGYEAHMAFDGPTAIRKVKEVRPHIVLLDIIMPGMGGIDVLKEIKNRSYGRGCHAHSCCRP